MAIEVKMPKMGLTMTAGTIAGWLKKEGDLVKKGETLLEITTEKITNTVEAPADGILLKIIAAEGEELPIGGLLGLIGEAGEQVAASLPAQVSSAPAAAIDEPVASESREVSAKRIKATPAAMKLAKELKVDYTRLAGTGPGGRITKEDVEKAASQPPVIQTVPVAVKEEAEKIEKSEDMLYDLLPYSGMRKTIGENMSRSWMSIPRVTQQTSVDVFRLLELRKMVNEDADEKSKVSITDLLVKIVAKAIEMRPFMNAALDGNMIKIFKEIHLGIAVALEQGLIVPVVKHANKKSLTQISSEVKDLARKARENRLSLDEMSNGTFTLTNLGAYRSVDFFTPIINSPQAAILGIGRIVERPAVVNGQIVPRPMMGLSLVHDHRVIDGAPAAEFLAVLMNLLENPVKALV
ncbi:dihydrolipoyllysine-residue acetyltransferase component of acetoin cleaving system [Candidatus Vecturithrix granuli]|uniref:Dihydrolipoamide acetyltransferase component of pyruvate dehydrogenase complex n=1 Tax=Vecturithrix granuli TaxID=1499967 RepID=A0A081C3P4_VECG1|nr:dihydrolipoyllysine-residue acetyltransferase component of acetoin cleaving system [Candidatus Vecturithrix granuli]